MAIFLWKGNYMKTKNIILIIVLAVVALGIGLFSRQQNVSQQTLVKNGHHEIWYCPMHPHYTSDHPGQCPICGMTLVKKETVAQQEGPLKVPEKKILYWTDTMLPGYKSDHPGKSPMGMDLTPVYEKEPVGQGAAINGYTTIAVTAQGQQLAGVKTVVVGKKDAVKTIRAVGQYEGQVYAQVFEDDVVFIKVGQKAIVEVPAYHQKYEGEVLSIDSTVDETSRTIRVRIWFKQANQRRFKTNMFVNVEFPVKLKGVLIVPRDAVMDTGIRKIVFVQKDEGTFEPREIQTGMETDDGFEVKSGLKEGMRIVVSGNFLLDSESRVQAGLQEDSHDK